MFNIQKFDFLLGLYFFCIAVSELMGGKTFPILSIGEFHLNTSVAIFVLPLIYAISDTITEVFGRARAQSVVRSGLVVIFLLFVFSLLATHLPPTKQFTPTEGAYDIVFGVSARIALSSLLAFTIGQFMDVFIFTKIRQRLGQRALWLRTNAANFVSQFLDTMIFITLAFYALDRSFGSNVAFLFSLIIPYWLLKCFMSVIETPLVYVGVRWLKGDKQVSMYSGQDKV